MQPLTVTVRGGKVEFVYDDRLSALLALGPSTTTRASHVEPAPQGGWIADMAPSGGPVLGPFPLRADALDAERAWLAEYRHL